MCSVESSSFYMVLQVKKARFSKCQKIWPLDILWQPTCSPSLKSNMSARVFTESSSAPLVSSSRDSLSSPTMSMSGGSLGCCCDNSLKRERISKILFNHLAGLSSSEIGTEVFCWAATAAACLRVQHLIFQQLECFDDSESTDLIFKSPKHIFGSIHHLPCIGKLPRFFRMWSVSPEVSPKRSTGESDTRMFDISV